MNVDACVCVMCACAIRIKSDPFAIIGNNLVFIEMCNSLRLDNHKSNKNKRYTPDFAVSRIQSEIFILFGVLHSKSVVLDSFGVYF